MYAQVKNTAISKFSIRKNSRRSLLELIKKNAAAFIFVLLLFAGIIALTQEADVDLPVVDTENESDEGEEYFSPEEEKPPPEWIKGARWFRSNAGGMAIEEIPSRLAALRNEYALLIDIAEKEELPEYLFPFYDNNFFIEIRVLYEKGKQTHTQWIFRDYDGKTRLAAVFNENETSDEAQTETVKEMPVEVMEEALTEETLAEEFTAEVAEEMLTEETLAEETPAEVAEETLTEANETEKEKEKDFDGTVPAEIIADNKEKGGLTGFIEVYDENLLLTAEYRFLQDGGRSRTDYEYKDGLLLSSKVLLWEENDDGDEYTPVFADFFRYNRSSFLRSVQRIFYKESKISSLGDPVLITFPSGIMAAARNEYFIGERLNPYPEFFGEVVAKKDSKMSYSTDEKGRILSQTFYDEDDKVIWVIYNTWKDDRIISTVKEEGDNINLAEFEYDSDGDRVLERNYTNGVLERVVRTEGKTDIEELYLNGNVILQAVWEDGRKVSETRMR
jgi:antitoxin component YwqK of YwqJK toxin-antitoxin module